LKLIIDNCLLIYCEFESEKIRALIFSDLREVGSEARRKLNRMQEYNTIDLDYVENGASLIQMTMTY